MNRVMKITRSNEGVSVEPMIFLTLEQARRELKAANPNKCHHRTGQPKPPGFWENRTGYVYFILCKATKSLKIGFTAGKPKQRLWELQGANGAELKLLGYIPGTIADERALHKELGDHRIRREWFYYDCEVKRFVADLLSANAEIAA